MMYAPSSTPIKPGINKFKNNFLFTLPNLTCDTPETPVVNTSAKWVAPVAKAGDAPEASKNELDVIPYAMPSAPSTT